MPADAQEPEIGDPAAEPAVQAAADDDGSDSAPEGESERGSRRSRRSSRQSGQWWELPVLVLIAVAVAVIVKSFLVQPFYIPSESMERTLHGCTGCNGDKILVNKLVYDFRDPHPGDIVVFRAPDGWEAPTVSTASNPIAGAVQWFGRLVGVVPPNEKDLVKRVIAVGGQSVRCCDAQGRVQVSDNGPGGPWRSLNETYIYQDDHQVFGPVSVPKGRLWVMGDHRGDSADSRYHCGGTLTSCDPVQSTVPTSKVIGKAFVIAWPTSRWRTLGTPATFNAKSAAMATAGVAGSGLPVLAGLAAITPLVFWRRRRRRPLRPPPPVVVSTLP